MTSAQKLRAMANRDGARVLLDGSAASAAKFRKYMLIRTLMSVITGVLVWAFASLAGLQLAAEWGVIAFALNYIPFIGPFIATVFPTLFALAQFVSWQAALAVFACLNVIQFVIGSYIEPRVSGSALAISPFVVLFAVFFWTFLWGLFGAFIGVPITIALLTFCAQHPSSRWLSDLLGAARNAPAAKDPALTGRSTCASSPGCLRARAPAGTADPRAGRQCVDMETCRLVVGRFHDRRRRRNDPQPAALPNPVDVAMAVHRHDLSPSGRSWRTNQLPLIRAVPIRSEKAAAGFGYSTRWWWRATIQRAGKLPGNRSECSRLLGRDEAQCVGKGEMRLRGRVEQHDAQPILGIGRQHHRKYIGPDAPQSSRQAQRPDIGKCGYGGAVGRQRSLTACRRAVPSRDRPPGPCLPAPQRWPTARASGAVVCRDLSEDPAEPDWHGRRR